MSENVQTSEQTKLQNQEVPSASAASHAEEKHELLKKSSGGGTGSKKTSKQYTDSSQSKRRHVCPDYFGVKSYLHDFYDNHVYKDPQIYEEDDDIRLLLNPSAKRRRRCPPIWLKVCVWCGVNLLLFGMIGILVGYFVPQKPIIRKLIHGENVAMVDHRAMSYNAVLDLCKLVGLILFCTGGVLLASALLLPSILTSRCSCEDDCDDAIPVNLGEEPGPKSPIEMTIPATSKLKNVQPAPGKVTFHQPPVQDDAVQVKD
ncbi:neurensin-1-like [Pecten maximus]|uniref:neurensin-1-like n=1 Tax=Pecten maximus TaxID=6579 RepID=UPI001458E582|nr:neurensin-1-like [Pecten maximus]